MKTKEHASVGQMTEMMMIGERRLIPGGMAGCVGLSQALQDDIHRLQDITECAQISGDP
jgi:hypothetical protein